MSPHFSHSFFIFLVETSSWRPPQIVVEPACPSLLGSLVKHGVNRYVRLVVAMHAYMYAHREASFWRYEGEYIPHRVCRPGLCMVQSTYLRTDRRQLPQHAPAVVAHCASSWCMVLPDPPRLSLSRSPCYPFASIDRSIDTSTSPPQTFPESLFQCVHVFFYLCVLTPFPPSPCLAW